VEKEKEMSRILVALGVLALGVSSVAADQFWYTYEGNDYPEVEGPWIRYTRGGGAQRSLQDGALVLDGLADWHIVDEYFITTPPFVLDGGEWLEVDWRVRIDQAPLNLDAHVVVRAGMEGLVMLAYAEDGIWIGTEGVWVDFAPGVLHEYSLVSSDLDAYSLFVDGVLAHVGDFGAPYMSSGLTWGDMTEGATSLTTWDYVRFGVVPEPAVGLTLALVGLAAMGLRKRPTWRNGDEMEVVVQHGVRGAGRRGAVRPAGLGTGHAGGARRV
jgi:hypothetical protein